MAKRPTDKKDPYAAYLMPLGLTGSVDIPLPGTPAVFKVELPGSYNEDFNMLVMSEVSSRGIAQVDEETGEQRLEAVAFQKIRRDMFFEHCIVGHSGLPKGMDAKEFLETYALAKRTLWNKASELASQADEEAKAAMGKLETLPNGKSSGATGTTSTTQ